MRKLFFYDGGTKHKDDGNETERKAPITVDQHQQPPGGKEHQPQRCIKNGTVQKQYRMEKVDFLPH